MSPFLSSTSPNALAYSDDTSKAIKPRVAGPKPMLLFFNFHLPRVFLSQNFDFSLMCC